MMNIEKERLKEDLEKKKHWRRFGPYLSERQWATVREDYSDNGDVWDYFSHDDARFRAYRWGEDGIAGISDNHQKLCFAFCFWNENDPILKERLFGLTGKEGNHGEDVKEYYFYLDNTPTHSYMKYLYKYPHSAFPYTKLKEENAKRSLNDFEYELLDTGIFEQDRYFDIFIEYAKFSSEDLGIRLNVTNRAKESKRLHILPTVWFRNVWDWGKKVAKPSIKAKKGMFEIEQEDLGKYYLYFKDADEMLFTENETNHQHLFGTPNKSPYVKDAFHAYVVGGIKTAVNPLQAGTKAAPYYIRDIGPSQTHVLYLRLSNQRIDEDPFEKIDQLFTERKKEADQFYQELAPPYLKPELASIQRQAYAGLLWNKQFYHYVIEEWIKGDTKTDAHPDKRKVLRNVDWPHLYNDDILSVPDKWEYPCFFSWDTAFHSLPMAVLDPEYAKRQLILLTREWYMHPSGQLPAYEWSFGDVNPPVHAWAAWRVYKIEKKIHGKNDMLFLERVFQKLLLNFTWWVNRKDQEGKNIFQGGFLGLDNISIFNRSEQLPPGAVLYQSDATSWMGMYCLNMLTIALELAKVNPSYEDMASKFFEHFLYIAEAINHSRKDMIPLWNEEDGFYYDVLKCPNTPHFPLKVRSMVGIIPMFAVATLSVEMLERFRGFTKRLDWFLKQSQ